MPAPDSDSPHLNMPLDNTPIELPHSKIRVHNMKEKALEMISQNPEN